MNAAAEYHERAKRFTQAQSTAVLSTSLLKLYDDGKTRTLSAEERLVHAWITDELEERFPEASAAVERAFDEAEDNDVAEVDYVAVLLAHIPLD